MKNIVGSLKPGPENKSIKAKDMPFGSIAKVRGPNAGLYLIHTNNNGDEWIRIWLSTTPVGIEAVNDVTSLNIVLDWNVELLPEGTELTLKF
jgi:hypothetical protein